MRAKVLPQMTVATCDPAGCAAALLITAPSALRQALTLATPPNVEVTAFDDTGMIAGKARTFDDVAQPMRNLSNLVSCNRGLARIVERKRDGTFRVELVEGSEVIAVTRADLHFFAGLELRSTKVVAREVVFRITRRLE